MKQYLSCKRIDTAIKRAKDILIKRANKKGLYENFGEEEVREIGDKFIDTSTYDKKSNENRQKLNSFNEWCMTCDLSTIKREIQR